MRVVGILSPGIVVTDLLTAGDIEGSRRSLNAVADRIEAVAPFLVARILKNDRHGACINWLSKRKLVWRLAPLPCNTRDPFAEKTRELGGGRA